MEGNHIFVTERLADMLSELGFERVSEEMEEQTNRHAPAPLFGFYVSAMEVESFISLAKADRHSSGSDLILDRQNQRLAVV